MKLFTPLLAATCLTAFHPVAPAEEIRPLTLTEAHAIALQKHPKITVAKLLALAAWQTVDQARSAYYPNVSLNVAAVDADSSTARTVSPTSVAVSAVADRAGASIVVNQLITDFGRTSNLTASTKLKAKSMDEDVLATRAKVLLEVDNAYISALRAQSLLRVASDTVKERRLFRDQVTAMEQNELRSPLDLSFAEVNLQQAELLLSRAGNDLASTFATVAALLDESDVTQYQLTDEPNPPQPNANVSDLIATAFRDRPELASLHLDRDSALKFARAEGALNYPTVGVQVVAGDLPYHDAATNQDYAAAGVIVNWPIFNGKLYTAKRKEAELRAKSIDETIHDETNNVARDVRVAWLSVTNAYKNMTITSKLRTQAKKSFDLATARYNAGASSMVEVSQAQLALTSAEIDETSARYEYLLRQSILRFQIGALK